MNVLENKLITSVAYLQDGIGLCDGQEWTVRNCIIDLSECDLDKIDEATGITWGSSATFENCIFEGAGKLVLCGSGDKDKAEVENNKTVLFKDCIFRNFGRRGPEVQCGMKVTLQNCLIQNWCHAERFTVRGFAAWAHGKGSSIYAESCIFIQDEGYTGNYWKDKIGHIGQAFNDSGICGLFSMEAWRAGKKRGLVGTAGGSVKAINCYTNPSWIVLQNHNFSMKESEAIKRMEAHRTREMQLRKTFGV